MAEFWRHKPTCGLLTDGAYQSASQRPGFNPAEWEPWPAGVPPVPASTGDEPAVVSAVAPGTRLIDFSTTPEPTPEPPPPLPSPAGTPMAPSDEKRSRKK